MQINLDSVTAAFCCKLNSKETLSAVTDIMLV